MTGSSSLLGVSRWFPKPHGCPDARLQMIQGLNPGRGHYAVLERRCDPEDALFSWRWRDLDPAEQAAAFQGHLRECELFWVRSDITELIQQNLRAIEHSITLDPTYVPSTYGLVFFQGGVHVDPVVDASDPDNLSVYALSWEMLSEHLVINCWVPCLDGWLLIGGDHWPHDTELGDVEILEESEDNALSRYHRIAQRRWLTSLFVFLHTPRVVTTDRRPAERHAAKRSIRAGIDLNDTRVVYLRSVSNTTTDETGLDRYHHRWIVSGHWRSQPYGPRSERRRPTWISPHVKGPDGAPLLGGEKVRAVIR